jgi:acyl-CoA hydrolase
VVAASTGALTISSDHLKDLYANINDFRGRLLLRPSEISNCPEIIARLGICSMNTAIEVDIYGHVNSTKIGGSMMMNGVGGSADFTCNAMLSTFTCSSTTKNGCISSIVPFCSHVDHTEHYVDAIITEYGVADLRNKCATEKAEALIAIAHPDYRPLLREYMQLALQRGGHTPHILPAAFAMHDTYRRKGDMRLTDWREYII